MYDYKTVCLSTSYYLIIAPLKNSVSVTIGKHFLCSFMCVLVSMKKIGLISDEFTTNWKMTKKS